jgi:hypothetical protein
MSLDLVVLTRASASSYDDALAVWTGRRAGIPDEERTRTFADELESAFADRRWPFAGDPIVEAAYVELAVAPEAWEDVVPVIVSIAHRHGLVVLDPQWQRLFPPGVGYEAGVDEATDDANASTPGPVQVRIHHGDGTIEELEVDPAAASRPGRRGRRGLWARLRDRGR